MNRMLAVIDKDGVLVGRVEKPTDEEWEKAHEKLRFPHGFDNAEKRYKLVEWTRGKWRFEPITHGKDVGAENTDAEVSIVPVLARLMANQWFSDIDMEKFERDKALLLSYLKTYDAQG